MASLVSSKRDPQGPMYEDGVVRLFALAAVLWGVVGMLVGVIIASQLAWPELNLGIPWLSYGRLRPLHTNAVIFAFGGCALMATSLHVVQRTGQTRLFAPALAKFVFWGWQLVIVSAAISLPMGFTRGKEYAELEWPISILIAVVWIAYAVVFFGTVGRRKIKHIFVANWFFGAFIIAVALLHVVNAAVIPVSLTKSYSAYAGVQDAMVQWWYGHNAVGFDRRIPGNDVLLHSQASPAADLFIPLVHRPLLAADLHLYVGRAAPLALHGASRLGAIGGHGVFAGAVGAQLGWHDQRHHDLVGRMAQIAR